MSVKSSLTPEVNEEQIVFVAQEQLPNGEVPVANPIFVSSLSQVPLSGNLFSNKVGAIGSIADSAKESQSKMENITLDLVQKS